MNYIVIILTYIHTYIKELTNHTHTHTHTHIYIYTHTNHSILLYTNY
jgi:hypothetical protein